MIVTALQALGADPTFVNGGVIAQLGVSSGTGSDDLFVIEADESDGTFLLYDTSIALITNVDPDHLDHYGTDDAFHDAFATFANRAREAVVISADDAGAPCGRPSGSRTRTCVTFGESDAARRPRHRHPHRRPGVVHGHPRRRPRSTRGWPSPARTTRSTRPARSRCC